jgi:hypothetical protein
MIIEEEMIKVKYPGLRFPYGFKPSQCDDERERGNFRA